MNNTTKKIILIILILLTIALIHIFRLGQLFNGLAYKLYYSYFSDIVLPIAAYFLLTLNELTLPFLRKWFIKAGIIFAFTTFAEICQLFGIEVLGVTFDPLDILMYGIGVLIAAFLDVKIFGKYLGFWGKYQ
ncbi:hypothetical protein JW964_19900 [candidate division KSB1 bacterium]|nr:hypothetical protein [candidate division KSB1 bacterium]